MQRAQVASPALILSYARFLEELQCLCDFPVTPSIVASGQEVF